MLQETSAKILESWKLADFQIADTGSRKIVAFPDPQILHLWRIEKEDHGCNLMYSIICFLARGADKVLTKFNLVRQLC